MTKTTTFDPLRDSDTNDDLTAEDLGICDRLHRRPRCDLSRGGAAVTAARVRILGVPDPETETIESLLRSAGERVEYATVDGHRARPLVRATTPHAIPPEEDTGTRYLCSCGAPATVVCDIGKSRVLRCTAHAEGVITEGAEAAMESDSCWCGMRAAGWDVPACPVHGLNLTY